MKTLIVSGGRIGRDFALSFLKNTCFDYMIGVDNGLRFLFENQISPTHVVGDFDTAAPELVNFYRKHEEIEMRTFNPVKDATDTQIAIELALELGSTEIVILGATGSRIDHVLGNIQSMMLAKEQGVHCELLDENNRIYLIDSDTVLSRAEQYGSYVSLIPLTTEVTGVTLTGFKYPLDNHTFTSTGSASLGISNEILEEEGIIQMKSGIFILIESRD